MPWGGDDRIFHLANCKDERRKNCRHIRQHRRKYPWWNVYYMSCLHWFHGADVISGVPTSIFSVYIWRNLKAKWLSSPWAQIRAVTFAFFAHARYLSYVHRIMWKDAWRTRRYRIWSAFWSTFTYFFLAPDENAQIRFATFYLFSIRLIQTFFRKRW